MSDAIALKLEQHDISAVAESNMTRYAVKVIADRAIPDARDGLKPVQRRILYTMHTEKLTPESKFVKVSTIAGLNMAYYHPHGQADGVVIDLSEQWSKRLPLSDTHGNNGGIDGSVAAAGRYVSARQTKAAQLFLNGLDKNAVPMVESYYAGKYEPTVLPAVLPAALVNGTSGIALGMKTDILPHNPIELLTAAKLLVEKPTATYSELAKIVKGPDFPTGGILIATQSQIIEDIEKGSTSFTVRGDVEIVTNKDESYLEITSVPWQVNTTKLIESIIKVGNSTSIVQVEDILNQVESHEDLSIKIILKKNTPEDKIRQFEALLYKKTDLEKKYRSHNLVIANGSPRVLGIKDHLQLVLDFRLETLKRIWEFEKNELQDRLELVEGLYRIHQGLPILDIIKSVKGGGRQGVVNCLINDHQFTERQANYIADMSVYRLSAENIEKSVSERATLKSNIIDRKLWLTDDDESKIKLLEDLDNSISVLAEYTRLTKVVSKVEDVKIEKVVEVVESKPRVVIVKKDLQACQMGTRAFESQKDSADMSNVVQTLECKTDDYIVLLTRKGRAITRRVIDLENGNFTSTHSTFNKLIPTVTADDTLIGAVVVKDKSNDRLVSVSDRGYTKVIEPSKLLLNTNNRGYLKRSGQFSSAKNGEDEINHIFVIDKSKFDQTSIRFEVTHQKNANKTLELILDLKDVSHREDGAGGNGARHVNTWDGQRKILSSEVISNEDNED